MSLKIAYWTIYPNNHQSVFLNALRKQGIDVVVFYFGWYDEYRLALGWSEPTLLERHEFRCNSISEAKKLVPDLDDRLHVVSGYVSLIYWRLLWYVIRRRMQWVAYTEPSSRTLKTLLQRWMFAKLLNRYSFGVFAISPLAVKMYERLGVMKSKIFLFAYATPEKSTFDVIKKPDNGEVVFVFAGALIHRKAFDLILSAFTRLAKEISNVRLLVLGDGPLKNKLNRAVRMGLPIEYFGPVSPEEIDKYMAVGDVVLLPSRYDGWGMALVEGARNGLAMIASDRTGSGVHLIANGVNGLIVKAGDVESLYQAMRSYAVSPRLAQIHGSAARVSCAKTGAGVLAASFVDTVASRLG